MNQTLYINYIYQNTVVISSYKQVTENQGIGSFRPNNNDLVF